MTYIEIPDLHYHPKWGDIIKSFVPKIINSGAEFVVFPGDLFEAPIMNTDKGGINEIREIIKSIAREMPVCAIEGTPSHDGPGCYGFLEEVGLTLLKPGKVYGVYGENITDININTGYMNPDCLLFGIPELNKNNIMSKLNITAEQANAQAEELFYNYVESFIDPICLKHKDIPAVCLFHGNFSDARKENSNDIIIKSSDIVIHTERLAHSGITRWSLGHIHKPWESENISAGYAGSWGKSWGEADFIPAMNLVNLDDNNITRIPYGTPKRIKIYKPLSEYDKNIAYWLESDDPDAVTPEGHEWSRVTYKAEKKETKRIETKADTLEELFKIIDPDVSESVLKKVSKIDVNKSSDSNKKINCYVKKITVDNCILFNNKKVSIDLDNIESGLNEIKGGNGSGKSSTLSFCTPYPVLIGKQDGRSLKQFFEDKDGYIEKEIMFNNENHVHKIFISKNKVECYLTIEGQPTLDKGSYDEMVYACNEIYGDMNDYILTSFYVQPQQGKYNSGLMGVSMVDIRNTVQNIAGINREPEKRIALDNVSILEKDINNLEQYIKASSDYIKDESEILEEINTAKDKLADINIDDIIEKGKEALQVLDNCKELKILNDNNVKRKNDLEFNIELEKNRIEGLETAIKSLEKNKQLISDYEKYNDYIECKKEHERKCHDIDNKILMYKTAIDSNNNEIKMLSTNIKYLNKPCKNCGYIDPETELKITDIKEKIELLNLEIKKQEDLINLEVYPKFDFDVVDPVNINIESVNKDIEKALSAEAVKKEILNNISKSESELKNIIIDNEIDNKYNSAKMKHEQLKDAYKDMTEKAAELKAIIKSKEDEYNKTIEYKKELDKKHKIIKELGYDLEDWKYIANMLQPAKIPALELEIILTTIDDEATRYIETYKYGRFSFNTITQKVGVKNLVDKFDIMVHDAETGRSKSFLDHSPGEKAFLSDAYIKALVSQRNNRQHRKYSPVILDESDGPIQPELIPDFYNMQKEYWKETKVLLVSHNPASHEHIQNTIFMEALFE